jgi:hypothetical protein
VGAAAVVLVDAPLLSARRSTRPEDMSLRAIEEAPEPLEFGVAVEADDDGGSDLSADEIADSRPRAADRAC